MGILQSLGLPSHNMAVLLQAITHLLRRPLIPQGRPLQPLPLCCEPGVLQCPDQVLQHCGASTHCIAALLG